MAEGYQTNDLGFLRGGGEMGRRMRALDWIATGVGAAETWTPALKALVNLLLGASQPMFMAWGPSRTWFYNDAFIPILAHKHPDALGRPSAEVWAEAWSDLEPLFARVFAGEPVSMQGFSLELDRNGKLAPAHFDFSYTPARDSSGAVSGLFGVCIETTERVIAERRTAAAVERQRRQFEQAPGFIIVMRGPDHVVEFVNDSHRRVFASEDWTGKTLREAFPGLEDQGYLELLDEVYATGRPYEAKAAEVRLVRTPDGPEESRFVNFVYAPHTDDEGQIAGVFCEGFDVTDQAIGERLQRAATARQALLVELSDRFRELSDPADISYAAAEMLGRSLNISRAGYGTIDSRRETITIERDWNAPGIKSLAGVLHFRDYGSYIEELKNGVTVVITDAEKDPRTDDGAALKSISAQALVNMPVTEHGGFVALLYLNHAEARDWSEEELALIREVAERTRMAVQRRQAEEDLRALAASLEQQVAERTADLDRVWRNSRDLLVVMGADGLFRAVNPAWKTILGYDPADVVGRSFRDFVWPEDTEQTQAALDTAVGRHNLTGFENRNRRRDGTPCWISWHTTLEGDLVFAYGRDITAQKAAQAELATAQDALRQAQKMEAVGQLTGGLAHDFNNLLAGISGSFELMEKRLAEGRLSGLERYIHAGQDATRRAASLTQRLLAFSRRQTLDPRPVDVNRLIAGMAELIRRSAGPTIEVEVKGARDLWVTRVDASQLESSLLNLCINSRDAMAPGGGKLTIETENLSLDSRRALEHDVKPGEYITISVADTGCGMAPNVVERVFDPFFTTKPLGQGTGLGLSMVYGFVRQSGGQVKVHSHPGRGTTICLYLPRHSGPADAETEEPQVASDPGQGERILVIDDEATVRVVIAEVLESHGYKVAEAVDGPSGLRILESDARIDLLITDVGLPGGMNGRQVADLARVTRPALKTLFITGYAETAALGEGRLDPGMEVITKPFAMNAFAQRVREMLER